MATAIKTLEFEGATFTVEYTEFGDRLLGELVCPSGKRISYQINRGDFIEFETLWGHDDAARSTSVPDLLRDGLARLTDLLRAHAAVPVTYARGNASVVLPAVLGKKLLRALAEPD